MKSTQMCYKAWEHWQLAIENKIQLKAAQIAGRLNVLPDQLSRIGIRPTKWTLNDSILGKIFQIWEEPMIYLLPPSRTGKWIYFAAGNNIS